ncbi:EAL domain-containing protein [uncultured Roseobacter sp.]|uniref:putative bifunctional diguanylate cyclase/phosphodiesterase n=1 Tax=uncultured Roseobacter sp. TaxID=114847 RepID=UPI00262F38EE|nr:EAL domain-containing protein [uncultured Roseobacter sp.]
MSRQDRVDVGRPQTKSEKEPPTLSAGLLEGFADADVGLIAISNDGRITFASRQFLNAVGLQSDMVFGEDFSTCCPAISLPEDDDRQTARAVMISDAAGTHHSLVWTPNRSGGWIGVMKPLSTPPKPDPSQSEFDQLTGLGNRTHLKTSFERLAGQPGDEDRSFIALFLDLDHFKRVNDTMGHAVGDGLLQKVADRLRKILRNDDIIARIGGDEFAVLLPDKTQSSAEEVAARIVKMIGRPFLVEGHQLTVGVSIGLACLRPDDTDADPLLQRADIALYESKRNGRGQFRWFEDDMFAALTQRRDIEADLRKALLLDQFEIVFQPQMDVHDARISGFEALIRWNHPERGRISPLDFIGVAEETGMIIDIGSWVLKEACTSAVAWPEDVTIAVNVSSVQFEDDGFIDAVQTALLRSGLLPKRLELEITETALLENEDVVVDRMNELRALGVKISLDDFGIGYSSLNYLRKYPFDKVKIDQTFVREPFADESAHEIVEAVAKLGSAFGMTVLAEGVETSEQLSRIQLKGCSSAQGYLLSPPMAETEVEGFLKTSSAMMQDDKQAAKTEK